MTDTSSHVLTAHGIAKRFGSVQALDFVDFTLDRGEIHALLGANGAGKSTFIKILSGLYARDAGELVIAGRPVRYHDPAGAMRAGIAAVQQHPHLVPGLSGYENVFLGHEGRRPGFFNKVDKAALARRGDALLTRFPVEIDLSRNVGDMSAVEREIVAILQALAGDNIHVLILDEPTSTLTEVEREVLFRMMNVLRESGISILYITHRLEEVFEIADRLSVFRGGKLVNSMTVRNARNRHISLAELMLGEPVDAVFPHKRTLESDEDIVLEVESLFGGPLENVSFEVRRGEVVGIFGLVGSGLDELSKIIFGATDISAGTMRFMRTPYQPKSPVDALRQGVFLLPGDRHLEGLVLTRSSVFNVILSNFSRAANYGGFLKSRRNQTDTRQLADRVSLHPPMINQPVNRFSGGNQQKIMVAKGLYSNADLYVFVEPTIGVDIGAQAKIYSLIRALSQNAAVIVMSTDCDEVLGIADRCVALYKGRQMNALSSNIARNDLLMAGVLGEQVHG